ncbi:MULTISPECIES: ABC transporter ATP-binding protein [unclassified Curtobacterium]|uniref:ABC transporter ATP-binding protein n=1 Tax=unclassified Curtobacterium TaxID=257496 RepID=UPI000F479E83|nr:MULTISPECIES: ABC transporter ATP-binding protein [unclassified Curtobacterium]ROQ16574.1 putative ABC transport system ATP-binding protein [Curtobacterium sp. PhB171]ROQ25350.1 putative ABC transport system ATP-binding protein [Curtobacterium sp. PhB170]ROS36802.1 putative ABC transport system ATP-binding protein [Curtobacterium sp. PhB131]ROS71478.1 putative ABC transport system ATP-binding protein [Curtobacterium sp. PhB141]
MTALIESTALTRRFPSSAGRDVTVLDDVTLTIGRGELVTIVGPSGSGKSTLLQCLSGLDAPTAGTVRIDGTDLANLRGDALAAFRRDHLGFVFQSYNLIPALTAFENVALPLRLSTGSVDRAVVRDALDAVGLTAVARHRPGQLSGGQQQRVAIARTIVTAPDVVFADEPTGALDTESGARVLELLRAAAVGQRSVVMVTHDLEAAALGDRVLVLRDGRLHRELIDPSVTDVLAAVSR